MLEVLKRAKAIREQGVHFLNTVKTPVLLINPTYLTTNLHRISWWINNKKNHKVLKQSIWTEKSHASSHRSRKGNCTWRARFSMAAMILDSKMAPFSTLISESFPGDQGKTHVFAAYQGHTRHTEPSSPKRDRALEDCQITRATQK